MNRNQLITVLLPGLLPLIVFVIVDELYGTSAGLIVAISFGVTELIFTYVKSKVFDTFTLFDTLLIVLLGGISLLLDNDIFFKLKPALVGLLLCALLGVSAFSSFNLFVMMSKRYFKGIDIPDENIQQLTHSAKILFYLFLFHTALVVYSAFFMSTEAWAFISTVLFYLLFGLYFVYEAAKITISRRRMSKKEWLPLVDEKGTVTGKALRSIVHKDKNMLHPVVHMHVINDRRQLFLQKRSMKKTAHPGKWDSSVGGHVVFGETIENALRRESEEEINLKEFNAVSLGHYVFRTEDESELVFAFYTKYSGELLINNTEVDEERFWNASEINSALPKEIFTPNFLIEYDILKKRKII